jgi:hypothetical protein
MDILFKIKTRLFVVISLIISNDIYAQIVDYSAMNEIIIADSLYSEGEYEKAIDFYKDINNKNSFVKEKIYLIIAKAYNKLDNKDSSLVYVKKSIDNGKHYWSIKSLDADVYTQNILKYDTSNIYSKKLSLNTEMYINSNTCAENMEILDSLKILKSLDQKYRSVIGQKNIEEWIDQKGIDSINRNYLCYIVDSIGRWPGFKEVGIIGESASFLIAQHSEDSVFQLQCLKLMKNPLLNNNINPAHFAMLLDRYLLNTSGSQIFCSQIEMLYVDSNYIAKPKGKIIYDLKNVDILRSYFSMSPLNQYLNEMTKYNNRIK